MLQDTLQVEAELGYELISPEDMVDHFTKAKNRHHFAAILVAEIVDKNTRMKSNVCGRGKEKLDPTLIE